MSTPVDRDMEINDYFPVYDMLYNQIALCADRDIPLTDDEIRTLTDKLKRTDMVGEHMVYVFIRIHALRHSDSVLLDIPYGGEKLSVTMDANTNLHSDLKFDLRKFPAILCRMIDRFTSLHLRKMEQDAMKVNLGRCAP